MLEEIRQFPISFISCISILWSLINGKRKFYPSSLLPTQVLHFTSIGSPLAGIEQEKLVSLAWRWCHNVFYEHIFTMFVGAKLLDQQIFSPQYTLRNLSYSNLNPKSNTKDRLEFQVEHRFKGDMPNLLSQLPKLCIFCYQVLQTISYAFQLSPKWLLKLTVSVLRAFGPFYQPDIENAIRQN